MACRLGTGFYLYTLIPVYILRRYLLIYFLLPVFCCDAQTLTGIITEGQTGRLLSNVSVVNVTTQQVSYTNQFGAFSLPAEEGQQVVFSYVGYKTIRKLITKEDLANGVKLAMPILSYELSEFILRPRYTPYQLDSLHRRSVYSRTLAWKRSSSVMSPVSFIADRISHKSRQRYRFQKNFNKWEDEKYIDTRYTPELVSALTGLTGDSLGYFMNANPMPFDYARTATELELKMWIRYNYRLWLKNHLIPGIDTIKTTGTK